MGAGWRIPEAALTNSMPRQLAFPYPSCQAHVVVSAATPEQGKIGEKGAEGFAFFFAALSFSRNEMSLTLLAAVGPLVADCTHWAFRLEAVCGNITTNGERLLAGARPQRQPPASRRRTAIPTNDRYETKQKHGTTHHVRCSDLRRLVRY